MVSWGYDMQEEVVYDNSNLFESSNGIAEIYDSVFNADQMPEEQEGGRFYSSTASRYWNEDIQAASDGYFDEDQLPFHQNYGDLRSEYEPCLRFLNGCWDDTFLSYEHSISNNELATGSEQTEATVESNRQLNEYISQEYGAAESDRDAVGGPHFGFTSWFGYDREQDPSNHYVNSQEPAYAYSYIPDVVRMCDGVFGYWPCLHQNYQQPYGQ